MAQVTTEPARHKPNKPPLITAAEIELMERPDLCALWQEIFGTAPPKSLSRPFLRRALAFEAQARTMGGLPNGLVARLERMIGDEAPKRSPKLQAGARLLREWNGVTHVIDVTEHGFRWRNTTYRSLSVIAREITGAHWSGPRFFGLAGKAVR